MKLRAFLLTGLVAGALIACSPPAAQAPGQSADNAAPSAPMGAPAGMNQMQPGNYRTTVTVLEMNMPGVPANAMAQMHSQPFTTEHCVTATDISDFTTRDLNNGQNGMSCSSVRTNSSGGHIDNDASCTGPTGTRTMHMVGTYTTTRVDMEMTSSGDMPGGRGQMTQRMHMVTERIGECPAGSAAAP